MHLLPVPRHLPVERGAVTPTRLSVTAITLDFGNTLVRVDRPGLRDVVHETADGLIGQGIAQDRAAFVAAWGEERDRQFTEEVPQLRETDIEQRAVRVLARLRGAAPPPEDVRWDDAAAATLVEPAEVAIVLDTYSAAFLRCMVPVEDAGATLRQLAGRGFALAILSNWPLAITIDRYAAAQGWLPYLRAIVVSQRVGVIKPHPQIFRAAEHDLGLAPGAAILHVGDDWAADVVGASSAGWHTAYLRDRQTDTPLPTSSRDDAGANRSGEPVVVADLEIDELAELDALVHVAS
ncbi:MAG: hydrolase / 5-amino-6-(5-phospho-D-ribitylamino)uracil phosphatase [Chloroflexota bacterium]|jgi:HAD superfamily hydrolase (TIGR01509 family)|nr:hydrolase / 5-amino-6-(5-phospho-D-ribitylamino)uracil phosphatase [Chloroflexota bacterium]